MRKNLILAAAVASLLAAPVAMAAPAKQLSPRQMALIMQLNRAHKGMSGAQHSTGGMLGLVAGVGLVAGLAIGLGTSQKAASGG